MHHTLCPLTVVGSINVDITATASRLPTAGETIGDGNLIRRPGGKGANQAAAASRLGAPTRMIGATRADSDGTWMRAELQQAGVDIRDVTTVETATGVALIALDAAGENQIVVCPGANTHLDITDVSFRADEIVSTQLEGGTTLTEQLAEKVTGYFVVNAAPALPLPAPVLERADLFIVNESEYALLPALQQAPSVAVTLGAGGAVLLTQGEEVARAAAPAVQPVNTVGAGDAFCAALSLALRAGYPAAVALRTACNVGAAAVKDASSQPVFAPLEHYVP